MTIAEIRKELHQYIDLADEKKLKAIHVLLENEASNHGYTDEELAKFYHVLDEYEQGNMQIHPAGNMHEKIKAKIAGK